MGFAPASQVPAPLKKAGFCGCMPGDSQKFGSHAPRGHFSLSSIDSDSGEREITVGIPVRCAELVDKECEGKAVGPQSRAELWR